MGIENVAFDTEGVIAAYFHYVVFFWSWFEHDDCSLFNYIVVTKDYFEIFVLLLADDGASGVNDAALSEDNISYDLVQSQIENIGFFHNSNY